MGFLDFEERDLQNAAEFIRKDLIEAADDITKQNFPRFFKEKVIFHGVKSAEVGRISRKWVKITERMPKQAIFKVCAELLESDYCEEGWVAANLARSKTAEFLPIDFDLFADWIDRTIHNWAECDTFCNHTVGAIIQMYPQLALKLKAWAQHPNLWMRRAAAVSLIIPARKGELLPLVFELADLMLLDSQDMVQKGYGWLLKEASHEHQKEVFDFVFSRRGVMPRTALRYAIEKMPADLRIQAMQKPSMR